MPPRADGQEAARAAFSGGADSANIPTKQVSIPAEGIGVVALIKQAGLVPSKGEGFRTIEQGGLTMNGEKVTDPKMLIKPEDIGDGIVFKKGKKTFLKVTL